MIDSSTAWNTRWKRSAATAFLAAPTRDDDVRRFSEAFFGLRQFGAVIGCLTPAVRDRDAPVEARLNHAQAVNLALRDDQGKRLTASQLVLVKKPATDASCGRESLVHRPELGGVTLAVTDVRESDGATQLWVIDGSNLHRLQQIDG
jgi:hypothetical protein